MEYRCRVSTANGHVSTTTFVADNEARLRMELEEKGLFLLSLQPVGGVGVGASRSGCPPGRRRSAARSF